MRLYQVESKEVSRRFPTVDRLDQTDAQKSISSTANGTCVRLPSPLIRFLYLYQKIQKHRLFRFFIFFVPIERHWGRTDHLVLWGVKYFVPRRWTNEHPAKSEGTNITQSREESWEKLYQSKSQLWETITVQISHCVSEYFSDPVPALLYDSFSMTILASFSICNGLGLTLGAKYFRLVDLVSKDCRYCSSR